MAKDESKTLELKKEKELEQEEINFKNRLQKEEKIKLLIPLDPLNPNEPQIVSVNCVTYSIPRGKEVEVPKTIARIWQESYNKTIRAQMNARIIDLANNNNVEIID